MTSRQVLKRPTNPAIPAVPAVKLNGSIAAKNANDESYSVLSPRAVQWDINGLVDVTVTALELAQYGRPTRSGPPRTEARNRLVGRCSKPSPQGSTRQLSQR